MIQTLAPGASQVDKSLSFANSVLPKAQNRPVMSSRALSGDAAQKIIFHVDFDAFFVSCGLATRPELKGKPTVVCHSQGNEGGTKMDASEKGKGSTSEIASCSYEARAAGVKNGMSLGQARKLCPEILTIP